jgi:hypothetical protein
LEVSPMLAILDPARRGGDCEHLLRERTRELMELRRENTRLGLHLSLQTGESAEARYRHQRQQIRDFVQKHVPAGSLILVISKGDGALLNLPGCQGWHFPQTEHGVYAGHHPANSADAIQHLEQLRERGGSHLLITHSCMWWLDHYRGFQQHLDQHYTRLAELTDVCVVYALAAPCETRLKTSRPTRSQAIYGQVKHHGPLASPS